MEDALSAVNFSASYVSVMKPLADAVSSEMTASAAAASSASPPSSVLSLSASTDKETTGLLLAAVVLTALRLPSAISSCSSFAGSASAVTSASSAVTSAPSATSSGTGSSASVTPFLASNFLTASMKRAFVSSLFTSKVSAVLTIEALIALSAVTGLVSPDASGIS